jgi:hypothetical protein
MISLELNIEEPQQYFCIEYNHLNQEVYLHEEIMGSEGEKGVGADM